MISNIPRDNALPDYLFNLQNILLNPLKVNIREFQMEDEGFEYKACHFKCNQKNILFRKAKITPKKIGFFVTLWKRNTNGQIQPLTQKDPIDICIIEVIDKKKIGFFLFDKHILNEKGILFGKSKGKLGFRIYPKWTKPTNKQAIATQKWQILYFYEPNTNENQWKSIANRFS
ncbi:MepB family protein [Leptospira yanagawae]|uniref:MepB family protein n=1 Tax=Leptospira yanagawae TaxID=293069 RepID=UPI001FD3BEB8|nr:MepB family protein [Leptospira yanagawae]